MYKTHLLFLILFYTATSKATDYHFEQISPESGFAYSQIKSMAVDKKGMLWFSCSNGLYTYNSDKIVRYTVNSLDSGNIISNNIYYLYFDDNEQLWLATDLGYCVFNRKYNSFQKPPVKNPSYAKKYFARQIVQVNDSIYWCVVNNRLQSYNTKTQEFTKVISGTDLDDRVCSVVTKDAHGTVWAGFNNGVVCKRNETTGDLEHFFHNMNSPVSSICVGDPYLWVGYLNAGADKIRMDKTHIQHYGKAQTGKQNLLNNKVRSIICRYNGDVWIGSFDGINVIGKNKNTTIVDDNFNNLPYKTIFELAEDHQQGVWVGTWTGGLAYYNDYNYEFQHIKKIPFNSIYRKNNTSAFVQDNNETIWIGTENAGLKSYHEGLDSYSSMEILDEKNDLLVIKSLAIDKKNRLWIGSLTSGLWYGNIGQNNFKRVQHPDITKDFPYQSIAINNEGIWLATFGNGIYLYEPETNTCTSYNRENTNDGLISPWIRNLYFDSSENLWVGTNTGLSVKMKGSKQFVNAINEGRFQNIRVNAVSEVEKGILWVATEKEGILILHSKDLSIRPLRTDWIKGVNEVYNILTDNSANIWLSSDQGILKYEPRSKTFQKFTDKNAALVSSFNPNSGLKSKSGMLYFGSANGYYAIKPSAILYNSYKPIVYLTDFKINNKPFANNIIKNCNSRFLPDLNQVTLVHTQNSLSFSFVSNNFVKSYNNQYKYRLVNYEDEWTDLGTTNQVAFTKIPPGKYELQVLGSNNNEVWSDTPYILTINIIPPFWLRWYAYLTYALLLTSIIYVLFKEFYYRAQLKRNILIERVRHESAEQLFSEKQKFFTNISHEFRTPLTLILSPLKVLTDQFKSNQTVQEHASIIQRNADRLLHLTNEILDMRYIESGKVKLSTEEVNIIDLCKKVYECFSYEAIQKEINYMFLSKFKSYNINIDATKIEKVVYNLLSNAFKFTPDNSQIIVSLDVKELNADDYKHQFYTGEKFIGNSLEIKVKDFGRGLDQSDLSNIFDRFSTQATDSVSGTGLGLHIAQEYIRLHKGNIMVSAERDKGAIFTVNLPIEQILDITPEHIIIQPNTEVSEIQNTPHDSSLSFVEKGNEKMILLVEDHMDLRKYLKKELMKHFKVFTAVNGKQGYEMAIEIIPHLIISDVRMPIMDGNELTQKVKQNPATEHIPVILLTALAEKTSQLEGITHGADSYLIKPVDLELLYAHIKNLLETQDKILRKLSNQLSSSVMKVPGLPVGFLDKLKQIVIANITNSNFGVAEISEALNMSQSSLYRKIKQESNLSVSEYIREIRLNEAIKLMKSKKLSLDEIAFKVGFNSYSYFSRSFKQKYGIGPREFINIK